MYAAFANGLAQRLAEPPRAPVSCSDQLKELGSLSWAVLFKRTCNDLNLTV